MSKDKKFVGQPILSQILNCIPQALNSDLLVNFKNLYVGLSVFNFNRPDVGFYTDKEKASPRYTLHVSYNLNVSENLRINIYGRYFEERAYSKVYAFR